MMFVKPAPGREVRDPLTYILLDQNGREVPDGDQFWTRRVLDGDVTVEEPPPPPPPEDTSIQATGA